MTTSVTDTAVSPASEVPAGRSVSGVAEDDASMRAWAEELVARARSEGVELTGPGRPSRPPCAGRPRPGGPIQPPGAATTTRGPVQSLWRAWDLRPSGLSRTPFHPGARHLLCPRRPVGRSAEGWCVQRAVGTGRNEDLGPSGPRRVANRRRNG